MKDPIQAIAYVEAEENKLPVEFRRRLERAIASAVERAIDEVLDAYDPSQWPADNFEFKPPF